MDYAKELKDLLRPLGIYALDDGAGAAELVCIGGALDDVFDALEQAEADGNPLTASAEGLARWERLLPFAPASQTAAERRGAVAALLRIDGCCFTEAALNDTMEGCGIPARVRETDVPQTVEVSFPAHRGIPADFPLLQDRIERILPCHLAVAYAFAYCKWTELETLFRSWAELEAEAILWDALERLGGESA